MNGAYNLPINKEDIYLYFLDIMLPILYHNHLPQYKCTLEDNWEERAWWVEAIIKNPEFVDELDIHYPVYYLSLSQQYELYFLIKIKHLSLKQRYELLFTEQETLLQFYKDYNKYLVWSKIYLINKKKYE